MPFNPPQSRSFRIIALATLAAGWLCLLLPGLNRLTELSYDSYYLFQARVAPDEVLMVYMDDKSVDDLGQSFFDRWDRSLHAQLIDRLKQSGAKAIVFDLLFDQTTTNDMPFIKALSKTSNVVLAAKLSPQVVNGDLIQWTLAQPIPELKAVASWGMVEEAEQDKQLFRKHYPGIYDVPSMAWRASELTGVALPIDSKKQRWIRYYGPPGTIPFRSYSDILQGRVDSGVVSNKVIFVGANIGIGFTAGKGTDSYRTPYSSWTQARSPGVELNATVYLNLASRDWLTRINPFVELLIMGSIAAGVSFWFALFPFGRAALCALCFAVVISIAAIVVWKSNDLWFSWLIPLLVQLPAAGLVALAMNLSTAVGEKKKLEMMLAMKDAAVATPASNQPTSVIGNQPRIADHELLRLIGRGAYGEVWLGRDVIGSLHAVKLVHRRNFTDEAPYEREFKGIEKFTPISHMHPGLIRVLHVGRNDAEGHFFYVMELADDLESNKESYKPHTLAAALDRRQRLPINECVRLGLRLTDALQFLHSHQLLHRDIKPANIIFLAGEPKLADIGLVAVIQKADDMSNVGTPGYIPLEGPGTVSADIYSLGKVLYESYTGLSRHKFPALPDDLSDFTEAVIELNQIIIRACETDPADRYPSAQEMNDDLRALGGKIGLTIGS